MSFSCILYFFPVHILALLEKQFQKSNNMPVTIIGVTFVIQREIMITITEIIRFFF